MCDELRDFTINMKSLSQDIEDPIVVGAGDANGRTLRIIFTQHAEAHFAPHTKVYLKWHNLSTDTRGYNVFTCVQKENPPIWEIKYPKDMLYEGDVLCCIEIVDHLSIAPSTNFRVHVLADPDDGSRFVASDDYSEFQKATIEMANAKDIMEDRFKEFDGYLNKVDAAIRYLMAGQEQNAENLSMIAGNLSSFQASLLEKTEKDKQEIKDMIAELHNDTGTD